ncbi:MAG TPA: MFS transporter [Candidatus Binatia bacterium]|nr:MFS transporter [Candidatus Binatia bacterium]
MTSFRRLATELDPQVLIISLMTLVIMLGSSVISPVLPLLAQEFGVSYAGAGALVSAFAVGRIPFDFIGGTLVDRLSPRLVASGGAAFGVTMGYLGPAPAAIIADITPKEASGAVMGLYRMAGDTGLLLGPIAIGWTAGHMGFASAFAVVAGCIAAVAMMGMSTRETLTSHEVKAESVSVVQEVPSVSGSLSPRGRGGWK